MYETSVLYKRMKQVFKEITMNGLDIRNMPDSTKEARITRHRLLAAAEEMFAQKGFDGTAIRDITTKARRNPAAINISLNRSF